MHLVSLAGIVLLTSAASAFAGVNIGPIETYGGLCEASGAVPVPPAGFDKSFIVLDNESNIVRAFSPKGTEAGSIDLNPSFGLDPTDEDNVMDLEAATWFGDHVLVIGSLGRSKKGNWRPARHWLLALTAKAIDEGVTLTGPDGKFDGLLDGLAKFKNLEDAIGPVDEKVEKLAPKVSGINLEGMAVADDGISLILGFRNPVPGGEALLIRFENPEEVLFGDQPAAPVLEELARLDLGGRGIRSMEYSAAAGAYFIMAGPVDAGGDFELYRWNEGEDPEPVPGVREAIAAIEAFAPEGMMIDETGTKLRLFSDDEDFCEDKEFRSVVLTLD